MQFVLFFILGVVVGFAVNAILAAGKMEDVERQRALNEYIMLLNKYDRNC